jgi:hypothetical protein
MTPEGGSRKPRGTGQGAGPAASSMHHCPRCGRASLIRSRPWHLCTACANAIAEEVQARVRTIQESLRQIKEEPGVPGKLHHWDLILAQTEVLRQYEAQGILTTCPPPSTLLQEFQAQRDAVAQSGGAPGAAGR